MSKFTQENASQLLMALRQELELFEKIREITKEQTELIAAEKIVAFNESLDRRQELIEKINGLHQETDGLMQSYISYSSSKGGEKIGKVEQLSGEVKSLIAECAALNEKNEVAAREKSEEFSQKIERLSLSRKSLGTYIQNIEAAPELFDKMT